MKLALCLLFGAVAVYGQAAWAPFTGTAPLNASPPNCTGPGTPKSYCTSLAYPYAGFFPHKLSDWGSAAVDQQNSRIYYFGGGHGATNCGSGYCGNDVTGVNLAPGDPCPRAANDDATISNPQPSPCVYPASNPSPVDLADCNEVQPDGQASVRHTNGSWMWSPGQKKAYMIMGDGLNTCNAGAQLIQSFDPSQPAGSQWAVVVNTGATGQDTIANCALDTVHTSPERFLCITNATFNIFSFTPSTGTWAFLVGPSSAVPYFNSFTIDPDRGKIVLAGLGTFGGPSGIYVGSIDPSTGAVTYPTIQSTTGCSALIGPSNPGMTYDAVLHKVVGFPGSGNSVYVFDSDTNSCMAYTATGGPSSSTPNGLYGRFAYLPAFNGYFASPDASTDLSLFTIAPNGLGGSTITCVDRDGDGYGTGPGCTGPDSDDTDSVVHTGTQLITKWGTLSAAISHLEGFTPKHIFYLAPATPTARCIANSSSGACTGNDANTPCNTISAPCLTQSGLGAVAAGDAVIFRDNWNGRYSAGSGTVTAPLMLVGYPGELPVIDPVAISGALIITQAQSWLIVDNFWTQNYGGMQGGDNQYVQNPHPFHDNTFKHIVGTDNYQGFGPTAGYANLTIEDSVFFHNTSATSSQAGVYVSGTCVASTGFTFQRNLSYNNAYSGLHLNTASSGALIQNNIIYGNGLEGIAFESGTNLSTVRSNIVFDDNGAEFEILSYQDSLGGAFLADCSEYNVSNATWSSAGGGTATVTVGTMTSPGYQVGQNAYITGITPSGYNCTGTGTPNSGVGCVVTAVTATTISYSIASNPGPYVSGGTVTSGMGDQAYNLIENNTFWHNQFDLNGNPVGTLGTIFTASHSQFTGLQVLGDLGHNTFRNNIAVNYGDLSSNFRNSPVLFNSSWDSQWLSTDVFDRNLTWQTNGISGPPTSSFALNIGCTPSCGGYAVYDYTGAALNGGAPLSSASPGYTITNGSASDPKFTHASPNDYASPSLYNFSLLSGSPALSTGGTTGVPEYDVYGNFYVTTSSIAPNRGSNGLVPSCLITLSPSSPGPYTVTQTISTITATVSGCGPGPFTWSSVSLPTGLSGCNSVSGPSCTITGTVTLANTYNPTISATDGGTHNPSILPTIVVNPAPSITTSSPLPAGTVGIPYSQTLAATGGTAPLTWSVIFGSVPGLSLSSSGVLSGTPTAASTYSLGVLVTDANSITNSKTFSITIGGGTSGIKMPTAIK